MTDLVANVYAATIIPVPASTLALVLRLKARRMTRMGFGYDDGLAIAAWVRIRPPLLPRPPCILTVSPQIFAMGYTVDLIVCEYSTLRSTLYLLAVILISGRGSVLQAGSTTRIL